MKDIYVGEEESVYKVKEIMKDIQPHFEIVNLEGKSREHHQMTKKIHKHLKERFDGMADSREVA